MPFNIDDMRRTSLERIVVEFGDRIKAALDSSLFENIEQPESELWLLHAESNLAAAQGCVNAMKRIWPEGEHIYDRFLLAISELFQRRRYVEDFVSIFSLDIPHTELNQRHLAIMAKNRETLMIAGTYLMEAIDILKEQTGITLTLE